MSDLTARTARRIALVAAAVDLEDTAETRNARVGLEDAEWHFATGDHEAARRRIAVAASRLWGFNVPSEFHDR